MRAIFGLVGLLVTVAVVLWLFSLTSIPTAKEGQKAQEQTRQLSGRGEDGGAAISSFKVQPETKGNRLEDLLVTEVTPGGAVDQFYGLKKGDRIVEIETQAGMEKLRNDPLADSEMAKAKVHDAFSASRSIIVVRSGREMTLPAPAASTPQSLPPPRSSPQDPLNNIIKSIPGR